AVALGAAPSAFAMRVVPPSDGGPVGAASLRQSGLAVADLSVGRGRGRVSGRPVRRRGVAVATVARDSGADRRVTLPDAHGTTAAGPGVGGWPGPGRQMGATPTTAN